MIAIERITLSLRSLTLSESTLSKTLFIIRSFFIFSLNRTFLFHFYARYTARGEQSLSPSNEQNMLCTSFVIFFLKTHSVYVTLNQSLPKETLRDAWWNPHQCLRWETLMAGKSVAGENGCCCVVLPWGRVPVRLRRSFTALALAVVKRRRKGGGRSFRAGAYIDLLLG